MEGVDRLELESSRSSDGHRRDPPGQGSTLTDVTEEEMRLQRIASKRERNALTTKALASLEHIEQHTKRLIFDLGAPLPELDLILRSERELQDLQTTFSGLKRQTDALDKKKAEIRGLFLRLEARLTECRALHPSDRTPLQVNTGKPLCSTLYSDHTQYFFQTIIIRLQSMPFCRSLK